MLDTKINHPLLTPDHDHLRQEIREFAENEIKPVAAELDEKALFSSDLTIKMGKLGLFGMFLPKQYGGRNLDTLSYIIAVEELSRIDSSQAATVAAHNSLGIAPLFNYGTEEQKMKYLPILSTGKHLWAFGLTEMNAGSDALATETTANLVNNNWVVNGSKVFITNSSSELSFGGTIQAVTGYNNEKKELSTILIERSTEGYFCERISNKMVWRAADTGKMEFTDCKVPLENLLGKRGDGGHIMLETLNSGRLSIAAMGLGLAQGAFELAMQYACKRKQFGKPISTFQAISFKLAEMDMKIQITRNYLYYCCWLKDNNLPFAKEAAIAKLYSSEVAREVVNEALQIHGAYGLFKNNPIERFYRDQRILEIGEGTSEILKVVISKKLGL
jgi:alkylation response protein AidB-like acyl-CoA dehydrogenase